MAEGVGGEAAADAPGIVAAGEEAEGLQPVEVVPDQVARQGLTVGGHVGVLPELGLGGVALIRGFSMD